jgi:hypothetical protein
VLYLPCFFLNSFIIYYANEPTIVPPTLNSVTIAVPVFAAAANDVTDAAPDLDKATAVNVAPTPAAILIVLAVGFVFLMYSITLLPAVKLDTLIVLVAVNDTISVATSVVAAFIVVSVSAADDAVA